MLFSLPLKKRAVNALKAAGTQSRRHTGKQAGTQAGRHHAENREKENNLIHRQTFQKIEQGDDMHIRKNKHAKSEERGTFTCTLRPHAQVRGSQTLLGQVLWTKVARV